MSVTVKFKKLRPDAIIPRYQREGDAGMDLHWCEAEMPCHLWPGQRRLFKTGLSIEIPPGYEGQVRPRSGLALHGGCTVLNGPGTLDSSFRGDVGVILINHGERPLEFTNGDRIAQLVIAPVVRADVVEVGDLSDTARGAGGFGSTGK